MVSRLVSGAAVDRYESDKQRHRAVFKFLDTTKDRRAEEESRGVAATTVYDQEGEDEEYDEDYYEGEEYDDGMSGDYELELPKGKRVQLVVLSHFCFDKVYTSFLCKDN